MTERTSVIRNRVNYIDLFRAFGILMMIMGHIKFGNYFDKWIHAFHMPMFFFVSGWFFKSRENIGKLIRRKVRRLIVPYAIFELFQWLILMPFISEYRTPRTLLYIFTVNTHKIPIETGTFGISPIPGAMWFLTAIFITETLYIIMNQFIGNTWRLNLIVGITVVFGMIAPVVLPFRLPWASDAGFVGIGFFHIARIIRGTKVENVLKLKVWPTLIIGATVGVLIILCPSVNMRTGNYGWFVSFWINALGAIIVGWNLSRYADKLFSGNRLLMSISAWIQSVGKNSIVYLCFNQIVILTVTKLMDKLGFSGFVIKIPILILCMIILLCIEKLICNTKLRIIFSK